MLVVDVLLPSKVLSIPPEILCIPTLYDIDIITVKLLFRPY